MIWDDDNIEAARAADEAREFRGEIGRALRLWTAVGMIAGLTGRSMAQALALLEQRSREAGCRPHRLAVEVLASRALPCEAPCPAISAN